MPDVIVTHRLTKYYGRRCVVDSLNLHVPRGSVYGLLGRNGAGKSTTIKMLLGMVQPSYGGAELLGDAVRFTRGFYPTWNDSLLEQILDHFGLARRAKIRRLSRGERAQVSLALAVAPDPELLILDDPTLGLDTVVRRDFLESLIQIIQRQGRTILFSSHILGDVERVADRIGILVDGALRVDCPTEHFKESIRKVVLEFDAEPPELPACEGLVSAHSVGTRLELIFVGYSDAQRRLAEGLAPKSVEVVELNLEDAFIEYTRGPRRSLPIFIGDQSHAEIAGDQGAA